MKNLKMLYIALIALVAGVFTACTTDFEPGPQKTGPQVSFEASNPKSLEFTGNAAENAQQLTLKRVEKDAELEVLLLVEVVTVEAEGNVAVTDPETYFTIPESVTFAAGEDTAVLAYTVNQEAFANDKTYAVNFVIADETITTPYGYAEWKMKYALNPWELVKDSKGNNAKGKFRGVSAIDAFWGVASAEEFDVDIYKHKNLQQYKIADPWVKVYMLGLGAEKEEELSGQFTWTNADLVVDFTDPNNVKIPTQSMGITETVYGYGEAFIAGAGGTLEDGVITFPKGGIGYAHIDVTGGKLIPCNEDGLFRIVLPGVEIADYSLAVAYDGMDVAADNKTTTAKFKFTYGADVTDIKYMFVNGNVESDPTEALTTLFAGEDENIKSVENFVQGDKEVGIKVGMESGVYTMVAAPADKNGALRTKEAIVYSFYFKGIGEAEEHPCELTVGTDKFSVVYPDYASQYPDYSAFAYGIYGKEIKSAKYFVKSTAEIQKIMADNDMTMEQIVLAAGEDADVTKVNSEKGFVSNAIGLEAETEYSVIVWAENNYGETALVVATHTTDKAPEYTGELVIGDYKMSCTAKVQTGETTFEDKTFESVFTLSSNAGSATEFFVSNLGMADGKKWYATYDATAGTLTLDGRLVGLESKGSVIGNLLYGQAGEYYYTIFNAASEESKGQDPIVFGVDATTKQISSLKSIELEVAAFNAEGKYLGFLALYQGATTTIAPYTEQPAGGENGGENGGGENGGENGGASTASIMSVRAPFSSVTIDKSIVATVKSKFQSIKAAGVISNTKISGVRTVKLSVVEQYTPAKVKGFTKVKADAAAIRR